MKGKAIGFIAVLAGLVCACAVFAYTNSVKAEAEAVRDDALARYGGETVEVCVAARDLAPGETIDSSNTKQRSWLVDLLPESAISSPSAVEGRELTTSVLAGEVLSSRRFEGEGAGITVPAGMQAVTIEVTNAQAVGGALETGSRVEVYSTNASGVALVVSDAQVLAYGHGSGSRSWVTLAIAPAHVQEVIATAQANAVYLALPSA